MQGTVFSTFLLFLVLLCTSCRSKLSWALDAAGVNRQNLEAVIRHYADEPQKRDAARWLIENMPGHLSLGGAYAGYYDALDSALVSRKEPMTDEEFELFWQGLVCLEKTWHPGIRIERDVEVMDSATLIRDIDAAFAAWQQGEWARHLDYKQFKEWLLPYKCFEFQPIFSWRDSLRSLAAGDLDHLKECYEYLNNPRAAITEVTRELGRMNQKEDWGSLPGGYPILRPATWLCFPKSTCADDCRMTELVVKSKGVPISIDFITQWPDKALNHMWCAYPSVRGNVEVFDPFMSSPGSSYYPYSRFAKVFRWSYSPNESYLKWKRETGGKGPVIFRDPFFRDVTQEYLETSDLNVRLKGKALALGEYVYLAVFDNQNWKPVWWGRAWFGRGRFKNMGRRIMYIVLDRNQRPISDPFEVDVQGRVHYLVASGDSVCDFRISRKYPLYNHVFKISALLHGGMLEASEWPDFRQSEVTAVFPDWPLAAASAPVSQTRPYRYWRFCTEDGEVSDMAEIFLYDTPDGWPLKTTCTAGSSSGFAQLFDENTLTNYHAEGTRFDGAVDLGEPRWLDHVSFLRRGDGNVVFPGDRYRISFWEDGRWNTFLETEARDIYLDVAGIPDCALYYIRNLSGGSQHRIFTLGLDREEVVWH